MRRLPGLPSGDGPEESPAPRIADMDSFGFGGADRKERVPLPHRPTPHHPESPSRPTDRRHVRPSSLHTQLHPSLLWRPPTSGRSKRKEGIFVQTRSVTNMVGEDRAGVQPKGPSGQTPRPVPPTCRTVVAGHLSESPQASSSKLEGYDGRKGGM